MILNINAPTRILAHAIEQPPFRSRKMKRLITSAALALALVGPAAAECYADYKAKRDEPLQLHYGVAQVSDANCSPGAAEGELAPRLAADGWTLLNVLSTFGPEGLAERKASAGDYFLRY
jgi:hypothetical protein